MLRKSKEFRSCVKTSSLGASRERAFLKAVVRGSFGASKELGVQEAVLVLRESEHF